MPYEHTDPNIGLKGRQRDIQLLLFAVFQNELLQKVWFFLYDLELSLWYSLKHQFIVG